MIYATHTESDLADFKATIRDRHRRVQNALTDALDAFETMQDGDKNPLLPEILRGRIATAKRLMKEAI